MLNDVLKNDFTALGITENSFIIIEKHKNISEPLQQAILKTGSHPSILLIKNKISKETNFRFETVPLLY